jgi:V/A-type H+-transporting ATPase subunit I
MLRIEVLLSQNHLLPVAQYFGNRGILHLTHNNEHETLVQSDDKSDKEVLNYYKALSERANKLLRFFGINGPCKHMETDEEIHVFRDGRAVEHALEKLESEAEDIDAALSLLTNENQRLDELEAHILPLKSMDADLTLLACCNHMTKLLGTIPASILPRLKTGLSDYNTVIIPLKTIGESIVIMAFAAEVHDEVLRYALHSAFFHEIILPPHLQGTPQYILSQIDSYRDENNEGIDVLLEEKTELLKRQREKLIKTCYTIEYNLRTFEMISYFIKTRGAYLVAGWLPASELPSVKEAVNTLTAGTAILTSSLPLSGDSTVPVRLDNFPLIDSFQMLTETYGTPRYEELDPTLILAISSIIMFGTMFADVGHGIFIFLFSLAGIWLAWKDNNKSLRQFSVILILFGLSATVFGFLFGSVFGKEDIIMPLWLSPMHSTMDLFIYSCSFGAIFVMTGLIFNVINLFRTKEYIELCCDKYGLPGIIFYGVFLKILGSAVSGSFIRISILEEILLLLPLTLIAFKHSILNRYGRDTHLLKVHPAQLVIEGITEVAETIITFFSNTLSFIRIGAFAICHGGLCKTVYILAEDVTGGGIAGWIIIIGGNLFIIFFEGLIVSIQTIRLEYYEFFSKFFKAGGLPYEPFTLGKKD